MKTPAGIVVLAITLFATPAMAANNPDNDKAVWIALGVVFLGSFTAIGAAVLASIASRKKKDRDQK